MIEDEEHKKTIDLINQQIEEQAAIEVKKLEDFFARIENCENGNIPGGKILILEAVFIVFSKLNLINTSYKIDFKKNIASLDLRKDFGIGSSTSNKGNVEKRLNKALRYVKKWCAL